MLLGTDIATSLTLAQSQSCVLVVARELATEQECEAASGNTIQSLDTARSASLSPQGNTSCIAMHFDFQRNIQSDIHWSAFSKRNLVTVDVSRNVCYAATASMVGSAHCPISCGMDLQWDNLLWNNLLEDNLLWNDFL
jgi:hypothetical protein